MSRTLRLVLFAAVVATAVPIVAFSVALALAPQPTDFMCFWSGAALVSRGQDPYDPGTWSAAVDGLFPNWLGLPRRPPCPGSYGYPLWTAIATLPLGILPARRRRVRLDVAPGRRHRRRRPTAREVSRSSAAAHAPDRDDHARLAAGLAHGADLAVRRHRSRRARSARAAPNGHTARTLLSRHGPSPPQAAHRTAIAGTSATLYGLTTWLTGQTTLGLAVVALALAAFTLSLRGAYVGDAVDRVAVAVTMGLLAVPYLSSGDPIVLAAAWCAILRRAGARPIGIVLGLVVAADVVPWVLYVMREPVAPPGDIRNALELLVTAALLAIALRRSPSVRAPRVVATLPARG